MTGIKIGNSERVAFIGATGSGKTVLAKFLLRGLNRVVVIDPKHTFNAEGFKETWKLPLWSGDYRIIVRPGRGEDARLANLLWKIFKAGSVTIYCDEAATTYETFPETIEVLTEIARTGREKRVGLWCAMQRPRRVPLVLLTETESYFVFSVRSKDDRDLLRGYTGEEVNEKLEKYQFWYYRAEDLSPVGPLMFLVEKNQIIKV